MASYILELPSNDTTRHLADQNIRDAIHYGFDYLVESAATSSNVFDPSQVGRAELTHALAEFVAAAEKLDKFKKVLFRKRSRTEAGLSPSFNGVSVDEIISSEHHELIHCIIGAATESGELADVLLKLLELIHPTGPDETNVKEELGDLLWYIACGMRWAKTTFLTEMKRNINKLRTRHGAGGFNKERDIERNLDAERQVLEGDAG